MLYAIGYVLAGALVASVTAWLYECDDELLLGVSFALWPVMLLTAAALGIALLIGTVLRRLLRWIGAFALLCCVLPAHAEDWPQCRRDERHTARAERDLRGLSLAASITEATGSRGAFQIDQLVSRGDIVAAITARAGGLPGYPHTATRGDGYYSRSLLGTPGYTPEYAWPFSTSLGGAIETSSGSWPWMTGAKKLTLIESGLNRCTNRYCSRQFFDHYGIVTGRDDGSDFWWVSDTVWHGSFMFGKTSQRTLWSWLHGVTIGQEYLQPLGYTVREDGVWAGDYLITNQVGGLLNPSRWNAVTDPLPRGLCGLAVWTPGGQLIAELCGSFGLLSTDGDLLFTAVQDWRLPEEESFDPLHDPMRHAGAVGRTTGLLALRIPDLAPVWRISGFQTQPEYEDAPVVFPDRLVWAGDRGAGLRLFAFDKRTGAELWEQSIDPWRRRAQCAYYRNSYITQLIGSGNTVVWAGRGLSLLDAATGRVRQSLGAGNLYFNPIAIDGELWAVRTHGNIVEDRSIEGLSASEISALEADGWYRRQVQDFEALYRFDAEPPAPALETPLWHTGLSCGGDAIEVYRSVATCPLDLDGSGTADVADLVYVARSILELPPVPASWREVATIPDDSEISARIRELDELDVDQDGEMGIADIIRLARVLLELDQGTPEIRRMLCRGDG